MPEESPLQCSGLKKKEKKSFDISRMLTAKSSPQIYTKESICVCGEWVLKATMHV